MKFQKIIKYNAILINKHINENHNFIKYKNKRRYSCLFVKANKKWLNHQSISLNNYTKQWISINVNRFAVLWIILNESINQLINCRFRTNCSNARKKHVYPIKTSPFKNELSWSVFIGFNDLFNAYFTVYILNTTFKK